MNVREDIVCIAFLTIDSIPKWKKKLAFAIAQPSSKLFINHLAVFLVLLSFLFLKCEKEIPIMQTVLILLIKNRQLICRGARKICCCRERICCMSCNQTFHSFHLSSSYMRESIPISV